jgi:hypothetical protein
VEQDIYGFVPMGGRRENTRYECLVVLTDAVSALTSVPTMKNWSSLHLRADAKTRLEADPQTLAGQGVLLRRFAPMARVINEKMGLGDSVVNAGLAYFHPPFSDVPPGHWTASSVERLRKAGILVGYHLPDPSDGRGLELQPPSNAGLRKSRELFNAPAVLAQKRPAPD